MTEDEKGRFAEDLVMKKLQECGWYVLPARDFSGRDTKAPALQGLRGSIVMPDLDASRKGQRRWVECKYKDHREEFFLWGHRAVHCIKLSHWHSYFKVQEITGADVWLFFYEAELNNIISAPLGRLSAPNFHRIVLPPKCVNKGVGDAFFDIRAFDLFGIPGSRGEMWEMVDGQWRLNGDGAKGDRTTHE